MCFYLLSSTLAYVACQSLESHLTPITALDFSEPYGTLVSASQDDTQPRVWDLLTGEEIGRLRGHRGTVKCIQVEDHIALTGSEDGTVRIWDLRRVDEDDEWETGDMVSLSDVAEEDEDVEERTNGIMQGGSNSSRPSSVVEREGPCIRALEGHTKTVSAMYFEDECLVRPVFTVYATSFPLAQPQIPLVGNRRVRQDYATVGPHHRAVCHDHGHSLGNFASSDGGAR